MQRLIAVVSAIAVAGCATASKDIGTVYVSPVQYQPYDCAQLAAESQRLASRVQQLGGRLDEAASNDKAIGVVGALLFWPALFALGGTKQQEAEYARLRGEHEAVQQVAIAKKCSAVVPAAQTAAVEPAQAPAPAAASGQAVATPVALPLAPASAPTVFKGGKDVAGAERVALDESCHQAPQAMLAGSGAGFETYTVACANGDALMVRCEFGNCMVLR